MSPFTCDRFGHSQSAVGKIIYVFGGRMGTSIDEKLLDDLWAFDTDSKTWSEVEAKDKESGAPSPRSFHTSVVVGECIYVFGGCPKEGRQADLHRFDTRGAIQWTFKDAVTCALTLSLTHSQKTRL